ncbi:MAG: heme ABC transporter ATP-binding protein [Porticoccaceae bacterium]
MRDKASPVLRVDQISVDIEGVKLLDRVSFSIEPGEVMALVGPNGAGKSTLIRAISGEQGLSQGQIILHGRSMQDWPLQELATHTAFMPQQSVLEFPFTVREVVALGRIPHSTGQVIDARVVDEVLAYMDVAHLAGRIYPRLSGGERQRVQLARVLAQIWTPVEYSRLLVLDEPTSNFDLAHQQLVIRLLREVALQGISVLVVMHDLNLAMSCADRIAMLCCGQLQAVGRPESVLTEANIRQSFGVDAEFIQDSRTGRRHLAFTELHRY